MSTQTGSLDLRAVKQTYAKTVATAQPIYKRTNTNSTPPSAPTSKITATTDQGTSGNWTLNHMPAICSTNTAYKYLWTCNQFIAPDGTFLNCSDVVPDEGTTVIDGAHIVTGTVTADKLDATTINASNMLTVGAIDTTDSSTASAILNSEVQVSTNLLSYPYYRDYASGSPYTTNGITYTLNKDGTITATGTATANAFYSLAYSTQSNIPNGAFCLPAGTYTISGCPNGGSSTTYRFGAVAYSLSNGTTGLGINAYDYGNGATMTLTESALIRVECVIFNGHACPASGYTFKPMLEVGEIAHTFVSPNISDAAAQSATKYITRIDNNGIRVHPASTKNNSVLINANGMEIFKGGTAAANSVAFYGDTARIGKTADSHVEIAPTSIVMQTKPTSSGSPITTFEIAQTSTTVTTKRIYNLSLYQYSGYLETINFGRTVSSWQSVTITYQWGAYDPSGTMETVTYTSLPVDDTVIEFNFILNPLSSGCSLEVYNNGFTTHTLVSVEFQFTTAEQIVETAIGAYPDTSQSGVLRLGNGTGVSAKSNAMFVDWAGNGMFGGDLIARCNSASGGGINLTKPRGLGEHANNEVTNAYYSYEAYRLGRVIMLLVKFESRVAVAAGANFFDVNIAAPKPYGGFAVNSGFYGNHSIGYMIYTSGNNVKLRVRNASSTSLPETFSSDSEIWGSITYITAE